MKTKRLMPFLGMNNRLPPSSLGSQDGRWVKDALNVDFRNDGSVIRRDGIVIVAAQSSPHSLFENFMVRGAALYKVTFSPYSEVMLRMLDSNAPMSYCRIGHNVFASNGVDRLRIAGDVVLPWGMASPVAPVVQLVGGGLPAGEYLVQTAYYNDSTGEEGAPSAIARVSNVGVPSGGIRIPMPPSIEGATHVRAYVSALSGGLPYLAATAPLSDAVIDVVAQSDGREIHRRIEAVLPAGARLFEYNGRLCSVIGKMLYYGIPYRHGYYEPASGFIPFEDDINVAIGNQHGVYVATQSETSFLGGDDLASVSFVTKVFPYGAVSGTEFDHPTEPLVGWFGRRGLVVADSQGGAKEVMAEAVDVGATPASGAVSLVDEGEYWKAVSCGWCVNLATGAVSRYDWPAFTSVRWPYATKADGIYRANSNDAVSAVIDLGLESFGSEQKKHAPAIYVGFSSPSPMSVAIDFKGATCSYVTRSSGDDLAMSRADPGKGISLSWFPMRVSNTGGERFELTSLSYAINQSTRKI